MVIKKNVVVAFSSLGSHFACKNFASNLELASILML
jgi:hypothetical protein